MLEDKKDVLKKTEDILQREILSRSSLETKKLELMSEISGLKLRQASMEKENLGLRKKLMENEIQRQQQQQQQQQQLQQQQFQQQQQEFQRQQQQLHQFGIVDTIMTLPPSGAASPNRLLQQKPSSVGFN